MLVAVGADRRRTGDARRYGADRRLFREPPATPAIRADLESAAGARVGHCSIARSRCRPMARSVALVATDTASGIRQIYLRSLDRLESSPLAGTEGASYPFWSPGRQGPRLLRRRETEADRPRWWDRANSLRVRPRGVEPPGAGTASSSSPLRPTVRCSQVPDEGGNPDTVTNLVAPSASRMICWASSIATSPSVCRTGHRPRCRFQSTPTPLNRWQPVRRHHWSRCHRRR